MVRGQFMAKVGDLTHYYWPWCLHSRELRQRNILVLSPFISSLNKEEWY